MSPRLLVVIGILGVLVICIFAAMFMLGGGDSGDTAAFPPTPTPGSFEAVLQDTPTPIPTATPRPFVRPPTSSEGGTWLVILYQDADDKILEQDITWT